MSLDRSSIDQACVLITDGTHYTPPDVGEGVPFLTVKDFTHDGVADFNGCSHITRAEFIRAEKASCAPRRGDVLFSKDGTVGKVYVVRTDREFAVLSSMAILRPDPRILDPEYFGWVLRADSCIDQASRSKTGSAIRRIILKDLKRVEFPLPPLAEQKRIAGILDAADALRAKRRESIEQLDQLIQATFLDMFGDPVANPKRWKTKPLAQVCDRVIDCPHSTPRWSDSGVICLRTSNLGKGDWDWSDTRYVTEIDYLERTKRSEIIENDIILSREGTVGVLAIVQPGMRVSMGQRLVQLRVDPELVAPQYLLRVLLHDLSPEKIGRLMAGSTSKHLNVKDLRKLPIGLPPLKLQREYARFAHSLVLLKSDHTNHLDQLDTLFASLQSRAFRGEL